MNEDDIRERIEMVLRAKRTNYTSITGNNGALQTKFCRQVRKGSAVTYDILRLILDYFPDLSAEWLMRGVGSMTTGDTYNIDISTKNSHVGQQVIGNGNVQTSRSDKELLNLLREQQKQMGDLINLMSKTNG